MELEKRRRLERAGWKVGTVEDFLGLTPEESAYIEMKLELSKKLAALRKHEGLTQVQVARRLKSSQSRVAKMEAGDPSVSFDLLVRSLLTLGASPTDVGAVIAQASVKDAKSVRQAAKGSTSRRKAAATRVGATSAKVRRKIAAAKPTSATGQRRATRP